MTDIGSSFRGSSGGWWDRGSVTAEFAVAIPAALALVLLPLAMVPAITATVRCQDAASSIARQVAVSGSSEDADRMGRRVAGDGAVVDVTKDEEGYDIVVVCPLPSDPWGLLPSTVKRHAFAAVAA
ncbi:TadE family type IV pilus minor pilin [uncultured Bifidobacterium sp.]|uniref:TadE family type IV pilus minor pilin n=1 Tax=uncultured Bifidobacterium sp. TaxID=165187 RepID=UPI002605E350|nr:TadE family type IV pilus minor pilin [uncultured Bifidobacterium sp.]